jgi:hypothetical protein
MDRVKIANLAGDFAIKSGGVECRVAADAAAPLDQGLPKCREVVAYWRDDSDPGQDYSSFTHGCGGGVVSIAKRLLGGMSAGLAMKLFSGG